MADHIVNGVIANRWWNLNYLRHAIVLAAWLAALKTFAVFHQQREGCDLQCLTLISRRMRPPPPSSCFRR
jgi:hypothetical protein